METRSESAVGDLDLLGVLHLGLVLLLRELVRRSPLDALRPVPVQQLVRHIRIIQFPRNEYLFARSPPDSWMALPTTTSFISPTFALLSTKWALYCWCVGGYSRGPTTRAS